MLPGCEIKEEVEEMFFQGNFSALAKTLNLLINRVDLANPTQLSIIQWTLAGPAGDLAEQLMGTGKSTNELLSQASK